MNWVEGWVILNDVIVRVCLGVILWFLDVGLGKCNVRVDYIYMYIENSMGNLLIYEFFMVFL